jgi:hypothetical protein
MANFGREAHMRHELAEVVADLFAGIRGLNLPPRALDDAERFRIVDLANLAVRCRSSIERDPHSREIELVPEPEAPGRLAGVLSRILAGLEAIDTPPEDNWAILRKLALDSMPAVRRAALEHLVAADAGVDTPVVAIAIGYPTTTARRALEELAAFGVITRSRQGQGKPDRWAVTDWTWMRWAGDSVPEMSEPRESVPEMSGGLNGSRPPINSHLHNENDFSGTLPLSGTDRPLEDTVIVIEPDEPCPDCGALPRPGPRDWVAARAWPEATCPNPAHADWRASHRIPEPATKGTTDAT